MSDKPAGEVIWHDLTVPNADVVSQFYAAVVGWTIVPQSMGEYEDYGMADSDGKAAGGVCYARGSNASLPPYWLMYVRVPDLQKSLQEVVERGGKIVSGPREMGEYKFAAIQDPAGAFIGLMQD